MVGMKERMGYIGGTIAWKTKHGKGTEVIAAVPLKGGRKAPAVGGPE
jgi:signal transduction histidine kinase